MSCVGRVVEFYTPSMGPEQTSDSFTWIEKPVGLTTTPSMGRYSGITRVFLGMLACAGITATSVIASPNDKAIAPHLNSAAVSQCRAQQRYNFDTIDTFITLNQHHSTGFRQFTRIIWRRLCTIDSIELAKIGVGSCIATFANANPHGLNLWARSCHQVPDLG